MIFLDEERFIEEAVASVRAQSLADWELILVDDGSTDGSSTIARDLAAGDSRICYVEHAGHVNRGTAISRNVGVACGTAPYVAFIDGDDVWVPEKLAEQVELLESMPDVALVCGAVRSWWSWDPTTTRVDFDDLVIGAADQRLDPPTSALAVSPLGTGETAGPDLMIRRTAFDAVRGFEERFPSIFEDQSLCMKIFLRYPIYVSSKVWIYYRQHERSCCAQFDELGWLRVQREFLDWLRTYLGSDGDARVTAAVERARRELFKLRLRARMRNIKRHLRGFCST